MPPSRATDNIVARASRGLGSAADVWRDDLRQTVVALRLSNPAATDGAVAYHARRQLLHWLGLARQQRSHRRSIRAVQVALDPEHLAQTDPAPSPSWILSLNETKRLVHTILDAMSPAEALALRTFVMDATPVTTEAARRFGLRSRYQLRVRIRRSLKSFRLLAKKMGFWPDLAPQ